MAAEEQTEGAGRKAVRFAAAASGFCRQSGPPLLIDMTRAGRETLRREGSRAAARQVPGPVGRSAGRLLRLTAFDHD
jgi:hypothetical protein